MYKLCLTDMKCITLGLKQQLSNKVITIIGKPTQHEDGVPPADGVSLHPLGVCGRGFLLPVQAACLPRRSGNLLRHHVLRLQQCTEIYYTKTSIIKLKKISPNYMYA